MRIRAVHVLVPMMVLLVSGCGLLKKKKKTFGNDDPTTDPVPTAALEPPAVNRADLTRFPDEVQLHGQADFIRQITFARTAPNEGGTTVAVIDPSTPVQKWSVRGGSTLVSFDRAAFPGKRFAGWVGDVAFTATPAVAAGTTATAAPTQVGVKTTTTATTSAAPSAVVAGTGTPATGTCTLQLRSTSFTPSTATCSFNEKVRAGSPATLTYPCAGGPASARFSTQTFNGSADAKSVRLTNITQFPFQGCTVESTQTITGAPPNLFYSYSERIKSGTCKGVSTCTATGRVSATP